ncbi:homocysteine S-methyltransferase [Brevibacterium sandarakinum]|uniref:S-methylmethionine:homocysteine methyltransferase n=1 Tax=Brevibacterium sandarakinum TaxID=629680 RepID=A0A1H1N846_BRESA|nr:homocysteine S-methyltransferase [Brevibacterium sandarakinum]SDR95271.1 homocysteine S-methyltransferase [Brevibacterium sandarakinum]
MSTTFIQMLQAAVRSGQPIIIDGGLGTALESRGIDLRHELWSASLLRDAPDTLAEVHADFIRSGARIVTTASYQATPLGFERTSISAEEGRRLIERSVEVAAEAAAAVAAEPTDVESVDTALVAGSVGPYGAALGDGSEYTGDYHLGEEEFANFHRPRIEALVSAGADLLAIETQPSLAEIKVLAGLAEEFDVPAWLSVTLSDTHHLADGSSLAEVVEAIAGTTMIRAIGVNCVRPSLVEGALRTFAQHTDLPLIAYPNSGESYDATAMEWQSGPHFDASPVTIAAWRNAGARIIGGCCRTTPEDIAGLAAAVTASA